MMRSVVAAALAVLVAGTSGIRSLAGETSQAGPAGVGAPTQVILDEGALWRGFLTWRTPLVRKAAGLEESKAPLYIVQTPAPPDGWTAPDFADGDWESFRIGRTRAATYDYGFVSAGNYAPTLARQCLRGQFMVPDPAAAKGLTLSIAYRGGVIVSVNGKELARGHLPKDKPMDAAVLA